MNENIKNFNKLLLSVTVAMAAFFMAFICNAVHADAAEYYDEFVLDQGLDRYFGENFNLCGNTNGNSGLLVNNNNHLNIISVSGEIITKVQLTFSEIIDERMLNSYNSISVIDDHNMLLSNVNECEFTYTGVLQEGLPYYTITAVKVFYDNGHEHEHEWTHSVDGATITSTCGADDCNLPDGKLSLTLKNDEVAFSGSNITKADLFKGIDFDTYNSGREMELSIDDILLYAYDDTEKTSISEITSDGWYVAELTVEELTATLTFFIPTYNIRICNEDIIEGTETWNCCQTVDDSVYAHIHTDGTLHIFGAGMMEDFDHEDKKAYWKNYAENITQISIDEGITRIGFYAFYGLTNAKEVEIPESVTYIGGSAFSYCSSLESVVIPGSVKVIMGALFQGCSELSNVVIMNGVCEIESSAFWGCSELSSIIIPSSVESIGGYAFADCNKLSSITFSGTTCPSIDTYTFWYCRGGGYFWSLATKGTVYVPSYGNYTVDKMQMDDRVDGKRWKMEYADCQHTSDINNDGYCDYCGVQIDGVGAMLAGYSLSLNGDIGVDIYMELTESAKKAENARLAVTFDGVTEYISVSEALSVTLNEKTYTVFPFSVPAKDYRKNIIIQLEAGDKKSCEYTVTVEKYALYILNHSDNFDSKAVELAEKLVYYCAAADTYLNNASPITKYYNKDYKDVLSVLGNAGNTSFDETYIGSSLILKDKVTIRHYYSGSVPEELQSKATAVEGAYYYMDYEGIAPDKYDEKFDGGYSVYSYLSAVLSGENIDTGLKDLAVAMYQYSVAAKAYSAQAVAD